MLPVALALLGLDCSVHMGEYIFQFGLDFKTNVEIQPRRQKTLLELFQ
jgi:hypothetical protein